MHDSTGIRILNELIAALDRRLPQAQYAGEAAIAEDAAALRVRALDRIATLERELAAVASRTCVGIPCVRSSS